MAAPINANLSEAEIEQLADRLEANDDPDALTLEGVDGLFCALIASPRTVMPNEYLPTIFGAEESAFADLEDANAAMSLLMRYWNSIIADLERESIHLPFVFDAEAGKCRAVNGRKASWRVPVWRGTVGKNSSRARKRDSSS
jgi:yecA family protein